MKASGLLRLHLAMVELLLSGRMLTKYGNRKFDGFILSECRQSVNLHDTPPLPKPPFHAGVPFTSHDTYAVIENYRKQTSTTGEVIHHYKYFDESRLADVKNEFEYFIDNSLINNAALYRQYVAVHGLIFNCVAEVGRCLAEIALDPKTIEDRCASLIIQLHDHHVVRFKDNPIAKDSILIDEIIAVVEGLRALKHMPLCSEIDVDMYRCLSEISSYAIKIITGQNDLYGYTPFLVNNDFSVVEQRFSLLKPCKLFFIFKQGYKVNDVGTAMFDIVETYKSQCQASIARFDALSGGLMSLYTLLKCGLRYLSDNAVSSEYNNPVLMLQAYYKNQMRSVRKNGSLVNELKDTQVLTVLRPYFEKHNIEEVEQP